MNMDMQSEIKKGGIVIIAYEGLGSYSGSPTDKSFHPYGRMGCKIEAYNKGILVYSSKNASTLPDSISAEYSKKYNDGSPIPVTQEGKYDIYTTMHLGKHKAFELGKGIEEILVVRNDTQSTSYSINFHYRKKDDYSTFASSTGCITMLEEDLFEMFGILGIKSFNGEYIGKIFIDRSNISKELYDIYKLKFPTTIGKLFKREDIKLTWDVILKGCLSDPELTITAVNALKEIASLTSNLGDIEGAKFFDIVIEKVFEYGKTKA